MISWKIRAPLLAICVAMAGCASQPDKIQTSYVSPLQYHQHDCQQLGMEAERISRRTSELHGNLKKTADNDAAQMGVGLILFWPTLFFLEGGDGPEAAEYARLKGEKEALEKVSIEKKCGIMFAPPPEPTKDEDEKPAENFT